ncbi:MAG: hypothetical protein JNL02_10750 [Saprospiraceae bacterium]|nr:hypothetical protein [Saprospiraceae bacterium]
MWNKNFILAGFSATVINLAMNAGAYFLFLKDVFEAHPPVSAEFQQQLVRPSGELVGWAMAVTSITMGFFIAMVIRWSGARTFASGLKKGLLVGFLFWSSVNFGLYASSNHFSPTGVWADLPCSAMAMAVAAAVAAWVLGKEKKH